MADVATSRSGKPVNIGDLATVAGSVTAVSGTGPTATITFLLATTNTTVTVKAQDLYSAQTS